MEVEVRYTTRYAGRIERELRDIVQDMTMMCLSSLAMREILISERGRTELQRAISDHVTQSVEIEAAIARNIERNGGPRAA